MKIEVDEQGIVTVIYDKPSPERVRKLLDDIKAKHKIKNLVEVSKMFGLSPYSGKRAIVGWCADTTKATHLPIPQFQYELLLLLAEGLIPIESCSKLTGEPKRVSKKVIINTLCKRFNINPEYIGMDKYEAEYYWTGKLACLFEGTCTHISNLNDISLAGWVELFESELRHAELASENINQRVESIVWES